VVDHSGKISAFDPSGRLVWTRDPLQLCAARPWADERFVFAATAQGRVLKLEAATGRMLERGDVGERATSPLDVFSEKDGGRRLVVGTLSGRLLCLDAESLKVVWSSEEAQDMIQSRPLAAGGSIVFGSWDARLHAVDLRTGRPRWRWSENFNFYYAPAGCTPASDGERVFVGCPDGFVSAVDLASGKTAWRARVNAWESLGLSQDRRRLFVKSRTDEFHIVEAMTGRSLVRSSPAHGHGDIMPVEPVEWGGRIYYGAQNGRVYEVDAGGRMKAVLDLGPAGLHALCPLGGGRFAALNLDGTLVIFRVSRRPR
ncbi:MAG: hypothetical protein FJY80_11965, partial [Candidatus Aminicenantes bacterium]|nr:hypothetical protein [Candidatus Aminicenantes bacterium]